jgi:glutaconate CoA-transferase subunit B
MSAYTPAEMMIASASRALRSARTVLVGVGLPNIACNLARLTHSPDLILIYESGVLGAQPARLPLSIGDPTIVSGASWAGPMADLFLYILQGGWVDAALLGTAQIDRYGNLNSTVIGEYSSPKVRLPGSGGACEIAINARDTFVITRLGKRTFVDHLDFQTTPGHLAGGRSRSEAGIPGAGPAQVITDLALFDFDVGSGEMQIHSLHPGVELEQVEAEIGWQIQSNTGIEVTDPPTTEELRIIREELDPEGLYR